MRFRRLWSRVARGNYTSSVGVSRRPAGTMRPVARLPALDGYVGLWVAVKGDRVVAVAPTSRELVRQLSQLGSERRGAVMQFVPPPSAAVMVGVG